VSDSIIEVEDVQFSYPSGVNAIKGVSLKIFKGERVALLGPNGSGKSTLMLLMAGLLTPQKGAINVFGKSTSSKEFPKLRRRIGVVFQDPDDQLFTQSVAEDVEYGPKNLGLPEAETKQRSEEVLIKIGINHLKNRPPHRLSFGEKKKASLATALVLKPELLILDEPTANLDLVSRRGLIGMLNELNREGATLLVATHDVEALPELADRVVVISAGTMLGEGKTSEVLRDMKLLGSAGLEQPAIAKLFSELRTAGLVKDTPVTTSDAVRELSGLLKKERLS
jgi:cobalt/nickel transport system ATP-binding protein